MLADSDVDELECLEEEEGGLGSVEDFLVRLREDV